MDWDKVRAEYLQGGISYRQLSGKYHIPLKTLARRAKAEKWATLRLQIGHDVATRVNGIIEKEVTAGRAKCDLSVYDVAQELLELTRQSVTAYSEHGGILPSKEASQYASALRSIRMAMERPTEMDLEEQRARIEKLRREAQGEDQDKSIEVTFRDGFGEYAQ